MGEGNALAIVSDSAIWTKPGLFWLHYQPFRNIFRCFWKILKEEVYAVPWKILIDAFILSNVCSQQLSLFHYNITASSYMDSTTDKAIKNDVDIFVEGKKLGEPRVEEWHWVPRTEKKNNWNSKKNQGKTSLKGAITLLLFIGDFLSCC